MRGKGSYQVSKRRRGKDRRQNLTKRVSEEPEVAAPPLERRRTLLPGRYRWVALMAAIVVVLGAITLASGKPI